MTFDFFLQNTKHVYAVQKYYTRLILGSGKNNSDLRLVVLLFEHTT